MVIDSLLNSEVPIDQDTRRSTPCGSYKVPKRNIVAGLEYQKRIDRFRQRGVDKSLSTPEEQWQEIYCILTDRRISLDDKKNSDLELGRLKSDKRKRFAKAIELIKRWSLNPLQTLSPTAVYRQRNLLNMAIRTGDYDLVKSVVDVSDRDQIYELQNTDNNRLNHLPLPLIEAIGNPSEDSRKILETLFDLGADVRKTDRLHSHIKPLLEAAKSSDEVFQVVLEKYLGDGGERDEDLLNETLLEAAKSRRHGASKVQLLFDAGLDANASYRSEPAFAKAAASGNIGVILKFLDNGADINLEHSNSYRSYLPLFEALHGREYKAVKLLLEKGADAKHIDSNNKTAINALLSGYKRSNPKPFLDLLKHHGYDFYQKDDSGSNRAFLVAFKSQDFNTLDYLLKLGIKGDDVSIKGQKPIDILKTSLLEPGRAFRVRTNYKIYKTLALLMADSNKREEFMEFSAEMNYDEGLASLFYDLVKKLRHSDYNDKITKTSLAIVGQNLVPEADIVRRFNEEVNDGRARNTYEERCFMDYELLRTSDLDRETRLAVAKSIKEEYIYGDPMPRSVSKLLDKLENPSLGYRKLFTIPSTVLKQ